MKKTLAILLLVLSCLVLIGSVIFCCYSVYGVNRTLDEVANDSSVSGIDYLGIGWGYGIGLFLLSAFGLILSIISTVLAKQGSLKYISTVAIVLFILLLIVSLGLFFA